MLLQSPSQNHMRAQDHDKAKAIVVRSSVRSMKCNSISLNMYFLLLPRQLSLVFSFLRSFKKVQVRIMCVLTAIKKREAINVEDSINDTTYDSIFSSIY